MTPQHEISYYLTPKTGLFITKELPMENLKRQAVLEEAAQLFLKKGYEGTSMKDIARAVGMQAPGIYYYFKSKKAILHEIDDQCWCLFQDEVLNQVNTVANPEEKVKVYIRCMLKYIFLVGKQTNILDSDTLRKHVRSRKTKDRKVYDLLRDILVKLSEIKGVATCIDPTVGVFSLYNLVASTYRWYYPKRRMDLDTLADQIIKLFGNVQKVWHGI